MCAFTVSPNMCIYSITKNKKPATNDLLTTNDSRSSKHSNTTFVKVVYGLLQCVTTYDFSS